MKNTAPNYKKIYTDLICKKYAQNKEELLPLLKKTKLTSLDIINIDNKLCSIAKLNYNICEDQKFRSYDKSAILQILDYQKKHNFNNTSIAKKYNLSRNTVSKWKKIFIV